MVRRQFLLLRLLGVFVSTISVPPSISIVVDPTVEGPERSTDELVAVATLADAQQNLRDILLQNNGAVDVTILLEPGLHRVPPGGLRLTAEDSPSEGHVVAWIGSSAIVSGGENVTGWALANDPTLPTGVYKAAVPSAVPSNGFSRQLYVDGVRAKRTSQDASVALPGLMLEDRPECEACSYAVATNEPQSWSNPSDVEFVYTAVGSAWSETRCALLNVSADPFDHWPNCTVDTSNEADCGFPYSTESDCINNRTADHPDGCCWHDGGIAPTGHFCVAPAYPANNVTTATRLTMKQPCLWNAVNRIFQPIGGSPPATVENVREHLSTPGQWYFDRAAWEILYYPLPGQSMADVDVVLAVEETLVGLDGAQNQQFTGITFSFATWLRPGEDLGFVEQQSAACSVCPYNVTGEWYCGGDDVFAFTPGNVALTAASNISFSNCSFTHLGAYGASASGGSQYISFLGCLFSDVSAGAVMLGSTDSFNITDVSKWDANLTVADCTAVDTGVEYTGSTTIFAAYVADTTIEHNLIINASYSALTLGWGWGREDSRTGGNRVIGNRVEGAQTARCCDGGGLYTLGPQPNSEITANYLAQGAAAGAWGPNAGNAIYHDNGSGGFIDSSNVIDGTWGSYMFQDDSLGPYGPGAICPGRDGQAADCGMEFIGNWMRTAAGGTTSHVNTTYANNTQLAPGIPLPPDAAAVVAAAGPRQ